MKFSDTINLSGIIQTYENLTDQGDGYISGSTERLKIVTATINRIQHRVWHTIFTATGNWKYDDSNYSTLSFATTNIVLGQRRYSLPEEALTVSRIDVKDADGNWYKIRPITEKVIVDGIDDFMDDNGSIMYYSLKNGVIELFAPADYNSDDGIKVYFDRDSVDFATTDTVKTPGFASAYHEIIPIMAAIEHYKIKQPNSPTLTLLIQDQLRLEQSIIKYYSLRFKDKQPRISRAIKSYK